MTSDDPKVIVIPERTQIIPAQPNKPVLRDAALPVAGAVSAAATLLWVGRKVLRFALAQYQQKLSEDPVRTRHAVPLPDVTPKAITLDVPERKPQVVEPRAGKKPPERKNRRVIYRASWSVTVIQDE